MDANQYLLGIINKYIASQNSDVLIRQELFNLLYEIQIWANGYLLDIITSGSRAKGTAIKGCSDIDFLISLSPTTPNTLEEIYNRLYDWLYSKGFPVRKQNVSLGVVYNGYNIDLVPARKHHGHTNDHSLYCRKHQSWLQTNIQQHINYVLNSGRTNEIKIIKVWAKLHHIDFPSIYLEHTVINALKNKYSGDNYIANNVMTVLEYISEKFLSSKVIDIANSNNIISNDLNYNEKLLIVSQAISSKQQQYWKDIVW